MRYIDHTGEAGNMPIDSVPKNIGFAAVTITYDDVSDPHFIAWFFTNIYPRFVNPSVSH